MDTVTWNIRRIQLQASPAAMAVEFELKSVLKTELPPELQIEPDENYMQGVAEQMGLTPTDNLDSSVVFCIPQMRLFTDFATWMQHLDKDTAKNSVGFCMQNRDTWASEAKPGDVLKMVDNVMSIGHPGFEALGRVFHAN